MLNVIMLIVMAPWRLYYKTLWIRNLRKIDRFRCKLLSFLLSATNTLTWTSTLVYCGICTLQIRFVFNTAVL
jgi:hypothetical protein